jgi:hypothetical protein
MLRDVPAMNLLNRYIQPMDSRELFGMRATHSLFRPGRSTGAAGNVLIRNREGDVAWTPHAASTPAVQHASLSLAPLGLALAVPSWEVGREVERSLLL